MTDNIVIIDASVAIKAILPNPLQDHCLALVQSFIEIKPAAPTLWAYETTSAIAKSVHFGAITENEALQALENLKSLGVKLFNADAEQNLAAFNWTLQLNRASAYDSYYLSLAQTLKCDYWTADKRLFNALKDSHSHWVHWIEEIGI